MPIPEGYPGCSAKSTNWLACMPSKFCLAKLQFDETFSSILIEIEIEATRIPFCFIGQLSGRPAVKRGPRDEVVYERPYHQVPVSAVV